MKYDYVAMCQEKARKAKEAKEKCNNGNLKEKLFLGFSIGFIAISIGIVGRLDYETEVAEAKAKGYESVATSTRETVSKSTVRRVYGVTMDKGNTIYAMEENGDVHSWYIEDASEMENYTPIQLVYDTMGTSEMDDDEVITIIPVKGNSETGMVADFVKSIKS